MQAGQSPGIVNLSGSLLVERASALKGEIAAALEGGDNVLLCFSSVEELDLPCLQVLYAARISAKAAGKELHFTGTLPPRVARRLASCGFLRGDSDRLEDLEAALADF
jgi:anti-anti-sigma regulatory factor